MKTILSLANPAEIETECLVAVVLDRSEPNRGARDKPDIFVASADVVTQDATDVIASGETTGKMLESTLLHHPAKLKAKRLLLLGGGKAKTFSAFELRRLAGAAVRSLKVARPAQLRIRRSRPWSRRGRGAQSHRRGSIRRQLRIRTPTRATAKIRRSTP